MHQIGDRVYYFKQDGISYSVEQIISVDSINNIACVAYRKRCGQTERLIIEFVPLCKLVSTECFKNTFLPFLTYHLARCYYPSDISFNRINDYGSKCYDGKFNLGSSDNSKTIIALINEQDSAVRLSDISTVFDFIPERE
jgi:hypothetical protein